MRKFENRSHLAVRAGSCDRHLGPPITPTEAVHAKHVESSAPSCPWCMVERKNACIAVLESELAKAIAAKDVGE